MNTKIPILSICIPTYNRSRLLAEALESILVSVRGFEEKVEIIISDNASTDDTIDIVSNYQSKYEFIRYNRNIENVIDKNFFIAASLALGKYVWIFADDDMMEPNAIRSVLEYIERGYTLLVCNFSKWDNSFQNRLTNKYYNISTNIEFYKHNEVLQYFGNKLQYLTSIIIEKQTFFNLQEDEYSELHEYGISFAYSLYCGIYNNSRAILISNTLVRYRGDNSPLKEINLWYKFFVKGSSILFDKLAIKGYSKKSIKKSKETVLKDYILHDVSNRKRNGEGVMKILVLIYPFYKFEYYYWLVIVPIIIFPRFIIVGLHFIFKQISSKHYKNRN